MYTGYFAGIGGTGPVILMHANDTFATIYMLLPG